MDSSHSHTHAHPDASGNRYEHAHAHGHGHGDRHVIGDENGHSHAHGDGAPIVNRSPDLDPNAEPISLASFIALKYPDSGADRYEHANIGRIHEPR